MRPRARRCCSCAQRAPARAIASVACAVERYPWRKMQARRRRSCSSFPAGSPAESEAAPHRPPSSSSPHQPMRPWFEAPTPGLEASGGRRRASTREERPPQSGLSLVEDARSSAAAELPPSGNESGARDEAAAAGEGIDGGRAAPAPPSAGARRCVLLPARRPKRRARSREERLGTRAQWHTGSDLLRLKLSRPVDDDLAGQRHRGQLAPGQRAATRSTTGNLPPSTRSVTWTTRLPATAGLGSARGRGVDWECVPASTPRTSAASRVEPRKPPPPDNAGRRPPHRPGARSGHRRGQLIKQNPKMPGTVCNLPLRCARSTPRPSRSSSTAAGGRPRRGVPKTLRARRRRRPRGARAGRRPPREAASRAPVRVEQSKNAQGAGRRACRDTLTEAPAADDDAAAENARLQKELDSMRAATQRLEQDLRKVRRARTATVGSATRRGTTPTSCAGTSNASAGNATRRARTLLLQSGH